MPCAVNSKSLEAFYSLTVLYPEEETIESLRSGEIDWEDVIGIAYEFLSPLVLYKNINRFNIRDRFRPKTIEKLKAYYLNTTAENVRRINDFLKLVHRFNQEGIKVVPLKGLSLILDTYFDEGLRATLDFDVFVQGSDVKRSMDILKDAGYEVDPDRPIKDIMRPNQGQGYRISAPDKFDVDLHYRLFPWYQERYIYRINSLDFLKKEEEFGDLLRTGSQALN